jgi:diguanylate cyclase (GGDEF)-like protein
MGAHDPAAGRKRKKRPPAASPLRPEEHVAVLNEVARIATEDLELQPMLQRITEILGARFGWDLVALVRVDAERGRFVCEALSTTLPTGVYVGYSRDLGSGVVGEVAARGMPIVIDDVRRHPNYVDTLPGALSEVCVPVKHRGRVVAILNLESTRLAAFHGQLPLVETIAEQIAGAIASARLYEETKRRAAQLEILSEVSRLAVSSEDLPLVLDRIVAYVRAKLDLAVASIVMVAPTARRFSLEATASAVTLRVPAATGLPPEIGVVGRALRTGEPQLVLDVHSDPDYFPVAEEVVAEYAVPIRFRRRMLGAFNFESTDAEVFSTESCRVMAMLADQVAGVLSLAGVNRRLAQTKRKLQQVNLSLREANQVLDRLTVVDSLTHVTNRRGFDHVLELEWRRAIRARTPLSLLLVDIDGFKALNDAYGHQRGDDCLRQVASVLRDAVRRASDTVARYGGEEFAVILPETAADNAALLAETLRECVERLALPNAGSTVARTVTVSVGVATTVPTGAIPAASLVATADRALYRAKQTGRNRVCVAEAG